MSGNMFPVHPQAQLHMLHSNRNGSTAEVEELVGGFRWLFMGCLTGFVLLYVFMIFYRLRTWIRSRVAAIVQPTPAASRGADSSGSTLDFFEHRVRHIAIIMDGNRRYGRRQTNEMPFQQGSSPFSIAACAHGHQRGGEKLMEVIEWCIELGIPVLTVYAFSTENWKRTVSEISLLMNLFETYLDKIRKISSSKGLQLRFVSPAAEMLPPHILQLMRKLEWETIEQEAAGSPKQLIINICVSYGSRREIADACRSLAEQVAAGKRSVDSIDEAAVEGQLLRAVTSRDSDKPAAAGPGFPKGWAQRLNLGQSEIEQMTLSGCAVSPDIVLRTSGERRLSNFMLFQCAYSELFFLPMTWPELSRADFCAVLREYMQRQRRLGV